ncbi:low choriolytic enzyme-like [Syngnathus typhle]
MKGDMVLPRTRTAMKCTAKEYSCLWPKSSNGKVEIPYNGISFAADTERQTIEMALREIEARTCIRFIPQRNQMAVLSPNMGQPKPSFKNSHWLYLMTSSTCVHPSRCFSMLGRMGGKQLVALQRFGCVQRGIIQHEVLLALGFYHEHTRSNRDDYIRIHWENIQDYHKNNFEKQDTNNLGISYHYDSIMHYGK